MQVHTEDVAIIIGSKEADWPLIEKSGMLEILDAVGVTWRASALSAHRNRSELEENMIAKQQEGVRVCIAAAGMSAALPGDLKAIVGPLTTVLGVALPSPEMPTGEDAMWSMIRMPKGIPVCFMGIGKPGLLNAAWQACTIIALTNGLVCNKLPEYHRMKQVEAQPDFAQASTLFQPI